MIIKCGQHGDLGLIENNLGNYVYTFDRTGSYYFWVSNDDKYNEDRIGSFNYDVFPELWFKDHGSKDDYYGVKEIFSYACNEYLALDESVLNNDSLNDNFKEAIYKQIRRVMRKNFKFEKRSNATFKYILNKPQVIYLVHVLMANYFEKSVNPVVEQNVKGDLILDFLSWVHDFWINNGQEKKWKELSDKLTKEMEA